jgi:hypothetical protein
MRFNLGIRKGNEMTGNKKETEPPRKRVRGGRRIKR